MNTEDNIEKTLLGNAQEILSVTQAWRTGASRGLPTDKADLPGDTTQSERFVEIAQMPKSLLDLSDPPSLPRSDRRSGDSLDFHQMEEMG